MARQDAGDGKGGDPFTGVTGTFVVCDPRIDQLLVYNPARVRQRDLPAST